MSRARIVVHNSRMHFVRLCSGFKVQTNADISARVRVIKFDRGYLFDSGLSGIVYCGRSVKSSAYVETFFFPTLFNIR